MTVNTFSHTNPTLTSQPWHQQYQLIVAFIKALEYYTSCDFMGLKLSIKMTDWKIYFMDLINSWILKILFLNRKCFRSLQNQVLPAETLWSIWCLNLHIFVLLSLPPYQLTQFITLYQCAKPRCVSTIIKPDFSTDFAFAFTIVNIFPTHNARLSCEYLHLPGVLAEFQWSAMMSFRLTLQLLSGSKQNAVLETIFNFINPVFRYWASWPNFADTSALTESEHWALSSQWLLSNCVCVVTCLVPGL